MKLERYSQHGEEEIISKYLDIDVGTYVDIGSGEPIEISNTYALYKSGWRGVIVEPYPQYHEKIRKARPLDKLCIKAITNHTGRVEMYDTASAETFIGDDYKKVGFRFSGEPHDKYYAECYTMKEFIEEYPEVANCDFASIDIQTGEKALFEKCDFNIFKPRLMCVEYIVRGVDYRPNWEHFVLPYYTPAETMAGNIFYLRK